MVYAGFTEDMKTMLSKLKGTEFIAYECVQGGAFPQTYGNLRICLEDYNVDLLNEQKALPLFDTIDGIACFSCKVVPIASLPTALPDVKLTKFPVNEIITGVEIVQDHITVNCNQYDLVMDVALIIKTTSEVYMFARDIWFSEVITIMLDDDYDKVFTIKEVEESFTNHPNDSVTVVRSTIVL